MRVDLSKVGDREKLKAVREPHWQRLHNGCFLGYRPSMRGGRGTWIARAYDEDARKYRIRSLGDFGALPARDMFMAAKREAEAFGELVQSGGQVSDAIETVEQACREYAKGKPEAEGRFTRYLYNDPLARVKLGRLRRHHLREWRERLAKQPALVSRSKEGERRTRERSPASVNRDMVPVRAALFKVLAPGTPGTEAAWQEALTPIRNADRQRTLYLDLTQRRKLLAAIDVEAAPFVRALCLLPLRPGAMASLSAGDFDKRTRELSIGQDKSGKPRRIIVPDGVTALLTVQGKDKLPAAPMLMRAGGARWTKEYWNTPIAAAATAAKLPDGVTAYTLRHSVITDLVNSGLALLTVAQISDTSVEMIERHYGHLNRVAAEQALAGLAL